LGAVFFRGEVVVVMRGDVVVVHFPCYCVSTSNWCRCPCFIVGFGLPLDLFAWPSVSW